MWVCLYHGNFKSLMASKHDTSQQQALNAYKIIIYINTDTEGVH